ALQTNDGNNAAAASATLTVNPDPPTLGKAFAPTTILAGGTSTLTLTLGNVNPTAATLLAVLTDTLPAGMTIATPNGLAGTCTTASVTAAPGSGSITYANGASIPSGGCTISVSVTSSTIGAATNTVAAGALQTNDGNNAGAASAILTVNPDAPTITKAFAPATIASGGTST